MISSASHRAAVLRLTLPPLAAVLLFAAAAYFLILPATHEALLAQKRETLRAIVASAISLCERHHAAEVAGKISRREAQTLAAADLRALRYGEANKDYLWVIDHGPRMVVHPYRGDLEGQDLATLADPDGVPIFSESVKRVDAAGEGFIAYRWQWQDDAARIVPKLSYVRGFTPWGWIIGSGLYLNDVDAEIARGTRHLLSISAAISALLAVLLALGLRQGLLSERLRQLTEQELRRANARYEVLAQAAEEAVWLISDERVSGANRSACALFGCSESQLLGREAASLFALDTHEPPPGLPHEAMLATSIGAVPALITVSSASLQGRRARVLTARDLRSSRLPDSDERRRREAAEVLLREPFLHSLAWLQPAANLARSVPILALGSTREEMLAAFRAQHAACALLSAPDGGIVGIVSAGDLVRRDASLAYAAMSAPVQRLLASATLADAAAAFAQCKGHHLLLDLPVPRVLDAASVLEALRHNPLALRTAIDTASQEALPDVRQQMLLYLRSLLHLHVDAEIIAAEGTRLADAVLRRCMVLTLAELGPAPAPFEILLVGSQGRGEMMPGSDQDNALIYADGADPHWFAEFARQLVARYAAAGWPPCEGGTTCANPRWCLPLSAWRQQFSEWISGASPQALMEVATFFDCRSLHVDGALSSALRAHALEEAGKREVFLHQLSRDALEFRHPLTAFGARRADEAHEDGLDLKGSLFHFCAFARIESLRRGVLETGTGERLRALAAGGHLPPALVQESLTAWKYLLALRLQHKADASPVAAEGSSGDAADLKRALGQINALQQHLRKEMERHT